MSKMHDDLVTALAEISNPPLDGRANYGKYATLPACLDTARETLSKHNFAVMQMPYTEPDRLVTRLIHSTGEWFEDGGVPLACENKSNPQKMGSAITYARRYGLCSMLGIVGEEDDDGQRATPAKELPKTKVTRHPAPVPQKADDIPFDKSDEKNDWDKWVDDQISFLETEKKLTAISLWSSTNIETLTKKLKVENEGLFTHLLDVYEKRKAQLQNKGI